MLKVKLNRTVNQNTHSRLHIYVVQGFRYDEVYFPFAAKLLIIHFSEYVVNYIKSWPLAEFLEIGVPTRKLKGTKTPT